MKYTKRLSVILLTLLLMLTLCTAASAADEDQYGLAVKITSEKDEYIAGETVPLTIELTNKNTVPLTRISVENILPPGFTLASSDSDILKVDILSPEETRTFNLSVAANTEEESTAGNSTQPALESESETTAETPTTSGNPIVNGTLNSSNSYIKSPNTSDSSNLLLWGLILVFAVVLLLILFKNRKKTKQLLSLILCIILLIASVNSINVFSAAEISRVSFTCSKELTVDGKNFTAAFLITMDEPLFEEETAETNNCVNADSVVASGEAEVDPDMLDSDEDGLKDWEETQLGLDPYNPMSDGITPDAERSFDQTLSSGCISDTLLSDENIVTPGLSGNVTGLIDSNAYLEYENDYVLKGNHALVGLPVRVISDYSDLTLSFDYSELLTYDESCGDNLLIYQLYDGQFIDVDTVNDQGNNSLEASVSGDGVYFVLDVLRHANDIIDTINTSDSDSEDGQSDETSDESKDFPLASGANVNGIPVDIVFAIDTTSSMSGAINNVAQNIIKFSKNLLSQGVDAQFGLIEFKDITVNGSKSTKIIQSQYDNWFWSTFSPDMVDLQAKISNLRADTGGAKPATPIDALEMARREIGMRSHVNSFIILITESSYKVDNSYGITSMDEMIKKLQNDGITTLVVTTENNKGLYQNLYSYQNQNPAATTKGAYANIYSSFDVTLSNFAKTISETVNHGSWVMLSDYQYVQLSSVNWETNGNDTDGDGLTDAQELGKASTITITSAIRNMLIANGVPSDLIDSSAAKIYNYNSNPVLADSDFDGLKDKTDPEPKNNQFKAKMTTDFTKSGYTPSDTSYKMDYRYFFENNETFNKDLSKLSILFASDIYTGTRMQVNGTKYTVDTLMTYHGMDNVKRYNLKTLGYKDYHLSEMVVGHIKVEWKGVVKDIIAVSVRGTNGTLEEWSSNFDIGSPSYDSSIGSSIFASGSSDWKDKNNHKGFDIASNRLLSYLYTYLNSYTKANTVIWVTGHSRGAAIANIMGARLKDNSYKSFVYTFAAPNTTTISETTAKNNYKHIFNVINNEDFVPCVPMPAWNSFTKYGRTAGSSVRDSSSYKTEWGTLTGITPTLGIGGYSAISDSGLKNTIRDLATIAKNRDDCYRYSCTHTNVKDIYNRYHTGDKSNNNVTDTYTLKSTVDAIPANALPYCNVVLNTGLIWDDYKICQMPSFYMQAMSAYMAGSENGGISTYQFGASGIGLPGTIGIASRYTTAHNAMLIAGIQGITHAHYTESYLVLSNYVGASNFN